MTSTVSTPSKRARTESSTILQALARTPTSRKLTKEEQDKIDCLILDYIVANARPLSTVDSPSFKKLIQGLQPRAMIVRRPKLSRLLAAEYRSFQVNIKSELEAVETVCLTADMWSARHRSFLGITAHWIVEKNEELVRRSAAIGFQRFTGT